MFTADPHSSNSVIDNNNQYISYSAKVNCINCAVSPALYKDCYSYVGFEVYLVLKACLYRWVLSSNLNLVRLLQVLIYSGREFHVFGAAYLNNLAANVLCLIFGNSSIGPMVFDHMLSHAGFLMVMTF